jgi:2-polyprenyl-3-methyl-5-hydroxy-6-metoxy-1,4-benzoquinol methylase
MVGVFMHCPVCDGDSFVPGREVFDDRYGEPHLYRLAYCAGCGHIATTPRLKEADLPSLYGAYYPRKKINAGAIIREATGVEQSFSSLKRWWNGTDNQGQYDARAGEVVLDVGCGSGASLLEARALGATAFGIEADPNVKPIAEALGLNIHFGSLQDHPFPEHTFDLIVLNQVIEHLPDPDLALRALRQRLKPRGRIVLVFPNTASLWRRVWGDRWINWHIPYHLHHFDLKRFSQMAKRCGFLVSRHRTITPNVWTLLQLRAIRHKPSLGVLSPLWSVPDEGGSLGPADRKRNFLRSLAGAGARGLFAIINRIVDTLGLGDSLFVVLRNDME